MPTAAPSANAFLEPAKIVAGFGLRAGDHAADFGAGHGFFALALAQAVGRDGKVWAVDIQKPALDMIRSRAMTLHLLNIQYVLADLEIPGGKVLPERFMDFVLMGNILFQAEARGEMLREAWACLRPGGRLALIEWGVAVPELRSAVAEPVPADIAADTGTAGAVSQSTMHSTSRKLGSGTLGPPPEARIKKQEAKSLAMGAGFELDREFAAGPHHYGLLFIKK